jgi:hypothetical protein
MTRVVHCNKEPYDIYIGRPSKWGNPFTHNKDKDTLAEHVVASREEAIAKYHDYILNKPELLNALSELEDKVLGCWCIKDGTFPHPFICHGQILIELLENRKLKKFINKV